MGQIAVLRECFFFSYEYITLIFSGIFAKIFFGAFPDASFFVQNLNGTFTF